MLVIVVLLYWHLPRVPQCEKDGNQQCYVPLLQANALRTFLSTI